MLRKKQIIAEKVREHRKNVQEKKQNSKKRSNSSNDENKGASAEPTKSKVKRSALDRFS